MVLANSTKMCYTYDNLSRVTARTVKKLSDNSVISTETFSYDAAGNVTDAPDSCFAYDTNNRLISFNGNSVSYDLDGNMLSNGTLSCTYDSSNRLVSAGGHTYTYNAEDVRIRNLCEDKDTTYTYDTNCRLSKLLCKTTNGITTKYVYGSDLIGEENVDGFMVYHYDYRGSTVALTDINGTITDTFEYDTYGNLISRTGNSSVIFLYNGRDGVVTDSNGLFYMRARYYNPTLRRFINADILAGQITNAVTLNRYAYANGNPVSNVDPFGLSAERGNTITYARGVYGNSTFAALDQYAQVNSLPSVSSSRFHMRTVGKEDSDPLWLEIVKTPFKPIVKYWLQPGVNVIEWGLSKVNRTYSKGVGLNLTLGIISVSGQGGISMDTEGNIALQGTFSGNFTTSASFGASITAYETVTNAPSIEKLEGEGYQIGGSATFPVYSIPVVVGGDINIIPDYDENKNHFGSTLVTGISTPSGTPIDTEFHAGLSETATWEKTQINVFESLDRIFDFILGD